MNTMRMIAVLAVGVGHDAAAQSGYGTRDCNVGRGFVCAMMEAHSGREPDVRRWASIVIVWRGEGGSALRPLRDTVAARTAHRRFLSEQRAAEDSGRGILGGASGGTYYIATHTMALQRLMEGSRSQDSVFVLNMGFAVPGPDTAIVVLVDTVSTGTNSPRVVGAATIANNLAPTAAVKRWTSGDTTFIVRSRSRGDEVPATILEHPMVREFLVRAP